MDGEEAGARGGGAAAGETMIAADRMDACCVAQQQPPPQAVVHATAESVQTARALHDGAPAASCRGGAGAKQLTPDDPRTAPTRADDQFGASAAVRPVVLTVCVLLPTLPA